MPDNAELLKVRNYIASNTKEFFKIVRAKKFVDRFGGFHDGGKLTKPPKGFDADHPAIEYLKLKSHTVGEEFSEKDATSKEYPKILADSFKVAYPLVEFLRSALR